MTTENFKIVIAGGGIAGLSLALMLERNGIDFVLLEAYPEIAPQVGASIGLLPNGLRILDQLGVFETLLEAAEYPTQKAIFRRSDGSVITCFEDFGEQIQTQYGYPLLILDRQMCIQILYEKIQDKSKILTSERLATVHQSDSGVTVTTKSGNTFTGDILVGADGIHSTVRQKMWEEANKTDPTWIDPAEAQAAPATYAAIFAISEGIEGIEKGTMQSVFNEHFSYLIFSGPGDRTYWFLMRNLGKTVHGDGIPRFTKEDEEALIKEHWDDAITPELRLSDLYARKTGGAYTSLPEYVYKRWYFQRIITIGDACHKLEPISGQGGNNAIETAASLTNHLVFALQNTPQPLSTPDIAYIFENVQTEREDRARTLAKGAHARQRLEAMETPLLKFIASYLLPYIIKKKVMDGWKVILAPAVSLNMLPVPKKARTMPFHDEIEEMESTSTGVSVGVWPVAAVGVVAYAAFRYLNRQ